MAVSASRLGVGSSLLLGVFGGAWSAIVAFLCVPWYIRLLGIESYGLIGLFVTLQAVIGLLDMGVGATINREVARSVALGELNNARRLLRSLEYVYVGVALFIGATVALAAPLIGAFWIKPGLLDSSEVEAVLRLMGVIIALRWPVGLYYGTMIGMQRPQDSYRIIATITTIANIGAVLILLYALRSVWAYFLWQGVSAAGNLLWARRSAWRALGGIADAGFDPVILTNVLIQSVMMSGVALSGAILTQIDKFVVSLSIPLADFGRYSLAVVLASTLSVLFIPTFNVIYPRLSALVAAGRAMEQVAFYRLGTRLFLSCMLPIAVSAFFYAFDLLALWTGNPKLAAQTAPIAGWLCLGSALNGIMHFPYALQLARGRTKLPFIINMVLIAIMVPTIILLVGRYGALGGALGWFTLNAIYVVIGVTATHHYLLPGLLWRWVMIDVFPALAIAAVVVIGGTWLAAIVGGNHVARLVVGGLCSVTATGILLYVYPDARTLAGEGVQAVVGRLRRK